MTLISLANEQYRSKRLRGAQYIRPHVFLIDFRLIFSSGTKQAQRKIPTILEDLNAHLGVKQCHSLLLILI